MNHIIITGATKGIGLNLARTLARDGNVLHLVASSDMDDLRGELQKRGGEVYTYRADLTQTEHIGILMDRIFGRIDPGSARRVVLVNNAGTLSPMGLLGKHDTAAYRNNLELNFVAPALLSHTFVQHLNGFSCDKRLVFISSGAAAHPYPGWSHYCSTKAGTDMLMKCITVEQKEADYPVRTMAYNPGRTETAMQTEIRRQDAADFPAVESFVQAKEEGKLNSPADVAEHIAEFIMGGAFPVGEIVKFRPRQG
jgi:benzil reductase ((S)-benzoin forming)